MRKLKSIFCRHGYKFIGISFVRGKERYKHVCMHCGKEKTTKNLVL